MPWRLRYSGWLVEVLTTSSFLCDEGNLRILSLNLHCVSADVSFGSRASTPL
ncbi:hypothetical protein Mapa_004764 [Marchantia paleacea]|nr:hypothetical protein Mapa_004764 [Marchantia paleacea]